MTRLALALLLAATSALALTATDKAALQSQANALKATVDALAVDVPVPPATTAWPASKPDVLDIDLIDQNSVLKSKLLDGSPGFDGNGGAIHYGDMSGEFIYTPTGYDFAYKFSSKWVPPRWGVETNGLHYLESGTDGAQEPLPQAGGTCATCRMIFWSFHYLKPAPEYYVRYMVYLDPLTWQNDTELGIKSAGLSGAQLEFGPKQAGGTFPLQTYFYNAETGSGYGTVVVFPGVTISTGRWYTFEEHVRANTLVGGVYQKNGVVEVKVDGRLVWSRADILMFNSGAPSISSLLVQSYHGGLKRPAGVLKVRHARIAVCKTTWCGPAPEVAGQ